MKSTHKLLLIILDGWGIGPKNRHNAIWRAKTPTMDRLWKEYPHSALTASGVAVGLLPGQIGSSEVGHMHIGAGRVVEQELLRLQNALKDKTFFKNRVLIDAMKHAKKKGSRVHLIGLVSSGGVHGHHDHLIALLQLAKQQSVKDVFVHAILDGRDTPPASAKKYLEHVQKAMKQFNIGTIASLCGRFFAMDRDENWQYTKRAVELLTKAIGTPFPTAAAAIKHYYHEKIFDEFIEPVIIEKTSALKPNDSVIFFNFRADRMRQLVHTLSTAVKHLHITTMIPYGVERKNIHIAFKRIMPNNHLSELIACHGIPQLKVAESEKYAHLTYFFNGTREKPYPKEKRVLIPSQDVPTYDLLPAMSAPGITETVERSIGTFPVIFVNYANADMVGHSGNTEATIQACEVVDAMIHRLVSKALPAGYDVMITGDHGNAEKLYDTNLRSRHTAHTTNPVPFILVTNHPVKLKPKGTLTNIAPLALSLLHLPIPKEMGPSLQL